MGGLYWDTSTYKAKTAARGGADPFAYSHTVRSSYTPKEWKAHETLDPKKVAGPTSPFAGKVMREARDNEDHPESTPIAIFFDETGSMGNVPRVLQTKLAELFELLLRKGYVTDPQILFGAYGDAETDRVPLQVGQFESDNRVADTLENIFLEGNGGGNGGESAALAWYYMALHAATDAYDKRKKKGYLVTIGDEVTLSVRANQIKEFIGDDMEGTLTPREILTLAQKKWHVFHLVINNYAAQVQNSIPFYTKLLGDNAIVLENEEAAAETIAGIIGIMEGTLTGVDEFTEDLIEVGTSTTHAKSATKALAKLGSDLPGKAVGTLPPDEDDEDDTLERI